MGDCAEMSLMRDVKDSFKSKGLEYVSMAESPKDSKKTVITYKDASGKILTKEIGVRLADLEETVAEIDVIDPDGLADYLLG
jgi:hypothetical protein